MNYFNTSKFHAAFTLKGELAAQAMLTEVSTYSGFKEAQLCGNGSHENTSFNVLSHQFQNSKTTSRCQLETNEDGFSTRRLKILTNDPRFCGFCAL